MRISDWSSDVCSSDLVARNDDFINFVNQVAQLVATSNPADVAALADLPMGDGTVESTRTALIGKIGENVSVRRFKRIETNDQLASYVHGGKIGVLVEFYGPADTGKDLAMHIAATKPPAPHAHGGATGETRAGSFSH